jgi:hypothetical protein
LIQAARPGNRESLTGEVPELIKQVDKVTRDYLRFWLVRALASSSHPPTLQDWQVLKARIVGHAEAIVLEAVLRPERARRWRRHASQPLMHSLQGRYSIIPIDYADGHIPANYTRREYYNVIHQKQYESRASDLFGLLLGYPPSNPLPGLTPQQAELLEHLDLLARNVRRSWWMRDVEPPPSPDPEGIGELPPTRAMEQRLSDPGMQLRASIVAHAEEMALEAVLTPEQAEKPKLELWRRRGLHALLDPELATRLNLSKAQREELAQRLRDRVDVYHKAARTGYPLPDGRTPLEVVKRLQQEWEDELAHKLADLDQPIWEVLQPAQLRSLARLLDKTVAGYGPPKPKSKPKRSGRAG